MPEWIKSNLSWKLESLLSLLWKTRWINSFQTTFQCLNPVGASRPGLITAERNHFVYSFDVISYKWIRVFKNEPSRICRRQLLKLYLVHSWILWPKYLTAWLSQKLINLNSPEENNSINHANRGFRNPLPFTDFVLLYHKSRFHRQWFFNRGISAWLVWKTFSEYCVLHQMLAQARATS